MGKGVAMSRRAILVLAAALAACAMGSAAEHAAPSDLPPLVPVQNRVVPTTRADMMLSFAPVVRKAAPAVVNIYTTKIVERRLNPFAGDPFFEQFFRGMFPPGARSRSIENSLGSGVILDPAGIVVSNYHVVAGADEIKVVLADRREFAGQVIFADKESDLAVVKLDGASDLPTLALRDSDTLEVGDVVLAIGNPFGVGQTVTSGIVSGLGRTGGLDIGQNAGQNTGRSGVFIQTDAAINPGNSGGALVDTQGRLVGINTAILSRTGGNIGIGFAVPANLVAKVVATARAGHAELVRPWLGFAGKQVDGELAAALGLPAPRGVLVEAVHPASSFAAAGIERGDVITELDGLAVNTRREIGFRAATKELGDTLEIGYLRRGAPASTTVVLQAAADEPPRDRRTFGAADGLPGLTVVNVNPAVIEEADLPVTSHGVLVLHAQGPAQRVGLRPRDFIRRIGDAVIENVSSLAQHLGASRGLVVLGVERDGRLGQLRFQR
jgi:Do/DeqQ family serine protease